MMNILTKFAKYVGVLSLIFFGTDQISYRAGLVTGKRFQEMQQQKNRERIAVLKKELTHDEQILKSFTRRVLEIREAQKNAQR